MTTPNNGGAAAGGGLAEVLALLAKATPGPWLDHGFHDDGEEGERIIAQHRTEAMGYAVACIASPANHAEPQKRTHTTTTTRSRWTFPGFAMPAISSTTRRPPVPLRNQFASEAEWLEHLRLYFAAKAMQGWLASFSPDALTVEAPGVASMAYEIANAMLAARSQQ